MSESAKEIVQNIVKLTLSSPQSHCFHTRKQLNLNMAGQRAGKSQMIGIITGEYVLKYPRMKGFIGANTYLQLTQSTLIKTTEIWRDFFQLTKFDRQTNPHGDYVVDRRPPAHFVTFDELKDYRNTISFKNGALIYIGSLDNYKAHDGKEFCWAHLDETKDTREEAVKAVILARLSESGLFVKEGAPDVIYDPDLKPIDVPEDWEAFNPAWIHTSPAIGAVDWLVEMFELDDYEEEIKETILDPDDFFYKEFGRKSVCIFSTFHNKDNLPRNYIEGRLDTLSENEAMKFVYGYPFSKTGGEYYPKFERSKHTRLVLHKKGIIKHITFDFNVLPYMTMLCAQITYKTRYIDAKGVKFDEPAKGLLPIEVMIIEFYKEFCLESPLNTTYACCKEFIDWHAGDPALEVFYYGDSTGRNRIAGMGSLNNFKVIADELEYYTFDGSNRVPKMNMGVLTRRNLMNRIFEGKYPEVEIYFDSEMKQTIRDFENVKLGADGKLKERVTDPVTKATYEKVGHTSDACEYLVCEILKDYATVN